MIEITCLFGRFLLPVAVLLFVIEGLAVRADLDFLLFAAGLNHSFVGHQFVMLRERFDFDDFAGSSFGLETVFYSSAGTESSATCSSTSTMAPLASMRTSLL